MATEQQIRDEREFRIIGVSRADLQSIGFEMDTLTDENMEHIAKYLMESFLQGHANFWSELKTIVADTYGLGQHKI